MEASASFEEEVVSKEHQPSTSSSLLQQPAAMSPNWPKLPGFRAVSDMVFVQDPEPTGAPPASHPTIVVIVGWGDCLPKHLAKFSDGFRGLYPHSRQVLLLGPMAKAMTVDADSRLQIVMPALDAMFPGDQPREEHGKQRVLIHTLSNTGGINYAGLLNAYRTLHSQPLPHQLVTFDSSPGSPYLTLDTLSRWSLAISVPNAPKLPFPFLVTRGLIAAYLIAVGGYHWALGHETAAQHAHRVTMMPEFADRSTRRLYLYSKEDEMIGWYDVEETIARSKREGWALDTHLFEGSTHVNHMRKHGEVYWNVVKESWNRALEQSTATKT